jgi:serine/threonine protein phosphatase 1
MRRFVVGDIHGGLRGLKEVLQKVPYGPKDSFIFLGDYVDGWSDSAATIDFLIAFSAQYSCVFLRGNHDYLLEQYLAKNDQNPLWLKSGGASTISSYAGYSEDKKQKHLAFLSTLENYYIDDANRLFVHAGFTNQRGIEHEYYPNLVYWDRTLWEMACAMDQSLSMDSIYFPLRLKRYSQIFIGHTPTFKLGFYTPMHRANVWNIDTGAAFKGPLTIMDVQTNEYWQSKAVWRLYKGETGRN